MRPIDADALKKEMLETYEHEYPTASGAFDEFASRIVPNIISNAPTIDAEPVVHGRWIDDGVWDVCSVCGRAFLKVHLNGNPTFNYCPNCGVKMDEVSEC